MTCASRKMLRFMLTDPICADGYCLFSEFYDKYCPYAGVTEQHAMACIRHLESNGYIRYSPDASSGRHIGFELEHKAHHHFYFAAHDVWIFLRNSVIVPIIVSAITSYLAIKIGKLF